MHMAGITDVRREDGENGVLVDRDDVTGYAEAIGRLLNAGSALVRPE